VVAACSGDNARTNLDLPPGTGSDAGMRPLPDAVPHRPVGLAMMPDGSLLIGDDKGGGIWCVFYQRAR
jgi:glucose/arabinose dehydrogenase